MKIFQSFFNQIMYTLLNNFIHSQHYFLVSRDLKMENILLDKKKRNVKIVGEFVSSVGTNVWDI